LKLKGTVIRKFGNDINTDFIIPAHLLQESWEGGFFAEHAFEKYDPGFAAECRKSANNIVVAGENFGCGSSREQAVYALKFNGVVAVIALSFPDIFYRNAINNGLPLLRAVTIDGLSRGQNIEIDLDRKRLFSDSGEEISALLVDADELETVKSGGNLGLARRRLMERISSEGQG
jgi:3-isopropylmalate dehydratase small subunit